MAFSVVLFDDYAKRDNLLPLVATRPIANLRVGVLTIDQKWSLVFKQKVSYLTTSYLRELFPLGTELEREVLIIRASVLPSPHLVEKLMKLDSNEALVDFNDEWLAVKTRDINLFSAESLSSYRTIKYTESLSVINYPEDIFLNNADQIAYDLSLMEVTSVGARYESTNELIGRRIYVQKNVALKGAILDSTKGPIYIGENSVIEAGVIVHGPASIGANCRLKSGTVLYPNVTIGDFSVVSGELNNVVIWGNSAKGHYGYLGCAVIGEGCNLGAGTTNSNLKNDWTTVKMYNYEDGGYRDTNLTKCGVFIGDHAMLAIQSAINTGTVIGVGAQVAISKFIPKFVPDFSWMTDDKTELYIYSRFEEMIRRKASIKGEVLEEESILVLKHLHQNRLKEVNNQH